MSKRAQKNVFIPGGATNVHVSHVIRSGVDLEDTLSEMLELLCSHGTSTAEAQAMTETLRRLRMGQQSQGAK